MSHHRDAWVSKRKGSIKLEILYSKCSAVQVWQYDCCNNDEEATPLCLLPPPHQCHLACRCFSSLVEDAAWCMARPSSASCPLPTSAILHGAVSPLLWKMLHVWHVPPLPPAPSQPAQSRIVLFLLSCVSCFMYGTFLFTESLF